MVANNSVKHRERVHLDIAILLSAQKRCGSETEDIASVFETDSEAEIAGSNINLFLGARY